MISERKKYIIEMFLKRCNVYNVMKSHIDFSFRLLGQQYDVTEAKLKELKNKYNIDYYTERALPFIDKQFTIEEMQEVIRFYSSDLGKKMMESSFIKEINSIGHKMDQQLGQEFSKANDKF